MIGGGTATRASRGGPSCVVGASVGSRLVRFRLSFVAVAAMLALTVGCGSDDSSEGSTGSQQRTEESRGASDAKKASAEQVTDAFSGTFDAALETEGYTVRLGYDIDTLDFDVEVADAQPGEALLAPRASGQLTVTNTTEDRNTQFAIAQPVVGLIWEASTVPDHVMAALADGEEDVCWLDLGSARYCTLARVRFDFFGPETLAPDEEVVLPVVEPLSPTILGGDALVVSEDGAEAVVDFMTSTAPDLLWVRSDITGARPSPTWSCVTSQGFQGDAQAGLLAILDRDGEALIDGGGVGWYEKGGELCAIDGEESASGSQLFADAGCNACHALADAGATASVGPDLGDLSEHATRFGRQRDQSPEEYVRAAIVDPDAFVVPGFGEGLMPAYGDELSDGELDALVDYLLEASG